MGKIDNLRDDELLVLLKQDNEEAFTLLYQRYWKRMLHKVVFKLLSEADAEEIVQDAFLDIWRNRHKLQIHNTFHTYIAAIVRYKIMAKMAGNKKLVYDHVEEINQLNVIDDSTQQWIEFSNLQREIEMSVKALPEKCQLVFRMSRESGLTNKQIANNLGLSQKNIEAHISRALKFLRTSIGQFLFFL
ncbi:RNA polymerase sigma-70 factor [Pedobacter sp. PLR]|uniref:RNA polymerase sigma-70 factor n=1 Tax=Pedobacter sp. PLR TaxID=2994465 RepID=UPI0022463CBF|nr:RNA polymerase sigma-70 factor [Pedobacter sp. PLR]MCX2452243.1 RNA polymerase sigma-70 factor [Pedobacter sp. PLR]